MPIAPAARAPIPSISISLSGPSTSTPRRRWRIAFLLGLGILVNYFDRINLSVSHAALSNAFGISDIGFGYLSAAFFWTYGVLQLPSGLLLDKFGVRPIVRIGAFLWSVASFGAALSPNLSCLFLARFLLGVGEAPAFPGSAKAIGHWFPARERGLPTALFDAAAKLASAIGVPLIGLLLLRAGWRWSFAATGVISFLYFLLFVRVYRDPEEDPRLSAEEREFILKDHSGAAAKIAVENPALPDELTLGRLLRERKVLGSAIGFGAYNYVFYLLLTWLPSYLSYALHIDLLHSFLYTGAPWLIATACELFFGGWLVDRLIARGSDANRVRRGMLIGGMLLGLGILGAAYARTPAQALIWITLSIGGLSAAAPMAWCLPSLVVPRRNVGAMGGIMNLSSQISGIVAPIVTGYVVAARHSYSWAFGVAAAYLFIGVVSYFFLLGRIEQIPLTPDRIGQV